MFGNNPKVAENYAYDHAHMSCRSQVETPKTLDDHEQIFRVHTARMPLSSDVDICELAKKVRIM